MKRVILTVLAVSLIAGCAKKEVIVAPQIEVDSSQGKKLLSNIIDINKMTPEKFIADLSVKAVINGRTFNTSGNLFFNSDPLKMKVMLHDKIFRSPLLQMFINSESVLIYSPTENAIYQRSNRKDSEATLEISPSLLSTVAIGKIPLIDSYRITKVLSSENTTLVIVENENLFETISFTKEIPDKIIIISKGSKSKLEIYYSKNKVISGYHFYHDIKVISESNGNSLYIQYSNINPNAVFAESVFDLKYPKNVIQK